MAYLVIVSIQGDILLLGFDELQMFLCSLVLKSLDQFIGQLYQAEVPAFQFTLIALQFEVIKQLVYHPQQLFGGKGYTVDTALHLSVGFTLKVSQATYQANRRTQVMDDGIHHIAAVLYK